MCCLKSPNVMLMESAGVFYDHNLGSAVMYYHYVKPSIGYDYDSFFFVSANILILNTVLTPLVGIQQVGLLKRLARSGILEVCSSGP